MLRHVFSPIASQRPHVDPLERGDVLPQSLREFRRGLVADFDAASLSLADGAAVATWADSLGKVTATQATSGSRPAFAATAWTGGGPAVSFAGTKHLRADALAALANGGGKPGPMSVALVARFDSAAVAGGNGAATAFGIGGPSAYRGQLGAGNGNGLTWVSQPVGNGLTITGGALHSDEDTVMLLVWNGASSSLYVNGQLASGNVAWNPWTDASFAAIGTAIAASGVVANPFTGLIRRVCVWSRALDDAGWSAVVRTLRAQSLLRHRFAVLGDSHSVGYGIAGNASWCNVITLPKSCLGSGTLRAAVTNKAFNGRALVGNSGLNIEDTWATDLLDAPYNEYAPSVIVLWAGTNDLALGVSAATTLANYFALLDAMRAARPHDRFIAVPPLPRPGWLTESAALDAGIRAGWGAHANAFWDPVAVDPRLADPNSDLFQSDHIHLTGAAHQFLAADFVAREFFASAVNDMLRRLAA